MFAFQRGVLYQDRKQVECCTARLALSRSRLNPDVSLLWLQFAELDSEGMTLNVLTGNMVLRSTGVQKTRILQAQDAGFYHILPLLDRSCISKPVEEKVESGMLLALVMIDGFHISSW